MHGEELHKNHVDGLARKESRREPALRHNFERLATRTWSIGKTIDAQDTADNKNSEKGCSKNGEGASPITPLPNATATAAPDSGRVGTAAGFAAVTGCLV